MNSKIRSLISESLQSDFSKSLRASFFLISTGFSFKKLLFDKRFRKSDSKNTTKPNSKSPDLQFLFCINKLNFSDSFFFFSGRNVHKEFKFWKEQEIKICRFCFFVFNDRFSVNGKSAFHFQFSPVSVSQNRNSNSQF